jgi:Family of unknown function (DUF6982)/PilZ domain
MSPLELLAPEAAEAVPFSVRLAERRLSSRAAAARVDRRAHQRRGASDLEWLRAVRLLGGAGYDVTLVDLSEGGALIEVDAPLRPGVTLTLEMTGPGVDAAVPLEVLRCYIATIRGQTAIYRGACAFAHLIELPGRTARAVPTPAPAPAPAAADFIGTDATLKYLLERCASTSTAGMGGVTLERADVLDVLDALQARTSTRGNDSISRHTSDLLTAILPALRERAPREVVVAALEERMRGLPQRWQSMLRPISARLASLIDHCAKAVDASNTPTTSATHPVETEPPPEIRTVEAAGEAKSAFQRIVARHTDGKIVKGYTQDFHPSRPQFSLWPSIHATPKERVLVPIARLKALFFVRDFNGNPQYQERKSFGSKSQGRRVEVTFSDGEVVLGTTLNYRPDGQGFFVSPADPGANNTRVFVVSAALRRVRFL